MCGLADCCKPLWACPGLENWSTHSFGKGMATWLLMRKIPLATIKILGDWSSDAFNISCQIVNQIYQVGVTLNIRTYVHPGRICRFTYVVRWSDIPRKSRHGLTYFHFPVLHDLIGQCHSQFEIDRINLCGIFETIRVIQDQYGLPQSRFKANESTVLTSKWRAFLHLTWKYKQLETR